MQIIWHLVQKPVLIPRGWAGPRLCTAVNQPSGSKVLERTPLRQSAQGRKHVYVLCLLSEQGHYGTVISVVEWELSVSGSFQVSQETSTWSNSTSQPTDRGLLIRCPRYKRSPVPRWISAHKCWLDQRCQRSSCHVSKSFCCQKEIYRLRTDLPKKLGLQ